MRHLAVPAAALAAALLAPTASAQKVFGGPDPDRQASTVLVFDDAFQTLAAVSISYGQPQWKDEYDQQFEQLKGKKLRLGKNWWTTLDTCTPLRIGNRNIPAGSYVLGLFCNERGTFSLIAIPSARAMRGKMMPFQPASWKGGLRAPLKLRRGALEKVREKMEIEISADQKDPSTGAFAIRWGTHELRAKVTFGDTAPDLGGAWVGKEVGGPADGRAVKMTIDGDQMRFEAADGQEWYEAVLRIDHTATPMRAVVTIEKCPVEQFVGAEAHSLVQITGNTLKIAGNRPGDPSYPTRFQAGGPTRVFEFTRAKKGGTKK